MYTIYTVPESTNKLSF